MGEYADMEIERGLSEYRGYGRSYGSSRKASKPEKKDTNPVGHIPKVWSRRDDVDEILIMEGWIATLKPQTKRYINQLWCDSKACQYFVIEICKPVTNAKDLAWSLRNYVLDCCDSYNAILVMVGPDAMGFLAELYGE